MNYKRIIAFALALCLMPVMGKTAVYPEITDASAAEDEVTAADSVVIQCVGDKAPIKIGGTAEVPTWYSDNEEVAEVSVISDMEIEIIAVGKGTASVFAVFSNQILRFDVVVLKETPDEKIVKNVGTITLTSKLSSASADLDGVDNTAAVWESTDTSVAVVDEKGNITAVGKGECIITAEYGDYIYVINIISEYEQFEIEVPEENYIGEMKLSDNEPSKKINFSVPEDISVKFSSTDESVATVSADGIVTAKGSGTCRINIEVGEQRSYISVVSTYTGKTSDSTAIGNITLTADVQSRKMTMGNIPEGARITWESSDTSVAVVDPNGVIVAVGAGNCSVIADVGGIKYTINVTVDIDDESKMLVTDIKGIGKTVELQNVSSGAKLNSTDTGVATVDEKGVVTAVGEGFAVITVDSEESLQFLRVRVKKTGLIGDANCDGKVTIADSTAILQHLGNEDKYGLSPEGAANADVDLNPGVSGMDAIVLQMFDAKLINSLPYKVE